MSCCQKKYKAASQLLEPDIADPIKALYKQYKAKVLPAESRHQFSCFHTSSYTSAELESKPIVMFLGQKSVGKTSMIEYLLGGGYPDPQSESKLTADLFVHIHYADQPTVVDGPTLIADQSYSLKSLEAFGDSLITRLRASNFKSELLKHISILDTPGIFTSQDQTNSRDYNYSEVVHFLADRVDKIVLVLDAGKNDMSDEYKNVIQSLAGHTEKMLIVFNKSDLVSPKVFIQVRGVLMWSLGSILNTTDIPKVYTGSFWKFYSAKDTLRETILDDADLIIQEIRELINTYRSRRLNYLIKRAKQIYVHCLIMDAALRKKTVCTSMSTVLTFKFMLEVFADVEKKKNLLHEDMPSVESFCKHAQKSNPSVWRKIDKKVEQALLQFLHYDVTKIIAIIDKEAKTNIDYKLEEQEEGKSTVDSKKEKSGSQVRRTAIEPEEVEQQKAPFEMPKKPGKADAKDPQYMTLVGLNNDVFGKNKANQIDIKAPEAKGNKVDAKEPTYQTLVGLDNEDVFGGGKKLKIRPPEKMGKVNAKDPQYMTLAGLSNDKLFAGVSNKEKQPSKKPKLKFRPPEKVGKVDAKDPQYMTLAGLNNADLFDQK